MTKFREIPQNIDVFCKKMRLKFLYKKKFVEMKISDKNKECR